MQMRRVICLGLALAVTSLMSSDANAGGLLKKLFGKKSECCEPAPCYEPEPVCCEPEPEPTCCEPAPEPMCCEPAPEPCCEPEPAPEPACCEPAPEPCCASYGVPVPAGIAGTAAYRSIPTQVASAYAPAAIYSSVQYHYVNSAPSSYVSSVRTIASPIVVSTPARSVLYVSRRY